MFARCVGLPPRPSREFAPAGDLLLWTPKEVGKKAAPTKPPLRGALRCSKTEAARNSLRYAALRHPRLSQFLRRAAHAPRSSALLGGFEGGVAGTAEQPAANPESRLHRGIFLPPSEPAEERKALRPRAQHASSSDFAQLSERSVAKRVLCAASRPEYRREPRAKRGAGGSGAVSLVTFLGAQESDSPAGAKSPLGLAGKPKQR